MFTHIIPLEAHRFQISQRFIVRTLIRGVIPGSTSSPRARLSVLFCIVRGFCTATEKVISDIYGCVEKLKHTLFHVESPKLDRMDVVNIGRDSTRERVSVNRSF